MKKQMFISIIAGLGLLAPTFAETVSATAEVLFEGSSTLHDFEGTATTQPFNIELSKDPATGLQRISATAVVNIGDMDTHNGKRDKNMFKMLDKTHHPLITGTLTNAELPLEGTTTATLHLKIRNLEKDVPVSLERLEYAEGLLGFKLAFPVSLEAFELKAPSVMGVIRVADNVDVECTMLIPVP